MAAASKVAANFGIAAIIETISEHISSQLASRSNWGGKISGSQLPQHPAENFPSLTYLPLAWTLSSPLMAEIGIGRLSANLLRLGS